MLLRCLVLVALTACKGQNHLPESTATLTTIPASPIEAGIVFFSSDGGATWASRSAGIPDKVFLSDVDFFDSTLVAATKQQGVYRYDFTTENWQAIGQNKPAAVDIDAVLVASGDIYAGSQGEGVFVFDPPKNTWEKRSKGLENLIIRKLVEGNGTIYAGTNGGLFSLDKQQNTWKKELDDPSLQVNGIALLGNDLFVGTNRGAFKRSSGQTEWTLVLPERSLHNISVVQDVVYAMVYSELFVSADGGASWTSDQAGMPDDMYSFHVIDAYGQVLDAQWDGIYAKTPGLNWIKIRGGMPEKIAITELKAHNGFIVAASSLWYNK